MKLRVGLGKDAINTSYEARAWIIGASRLSIRASRTISREKERLFCSLTTNELILHQPHSQGLSGGGKMRDPGNEVEPPSTLICEGGGGGGLNFPLPLPCTPGSCLCAFSIATHYTMLQNKFLFLPHPRSLLPPPVDFPPLISNFFKLGSTTAMMWTGYRWFPQGVWGIGWKKKGQGNHST